MKKLLHSCAVGCLISLSLFVIGGIIFDFFFHGQFVLENYGFSKMAAASLLIGLGFALPSGIYDHQRLPFGLKVLIHMGIGCGILLLSACLAGWIPVQAGLAAILWAAGAEIAVAFLIWLGFYLYYRQQTAKINRRIKEKAQS